MRSLGRTLQVVGLVIPLSGIFLAESVAGLSAMTFSFGGLAFGAALFWAGWKIQRMAEG
ncbi:MAG: hypothetical protein ACYTGZ_15655 [Planctomycetota bacterium]